MSIINNIENFRKQKRTLFTTPSHGHGEFVAPKSLKMIGHKFFTCDYSEIEGFDNLSNPKGIIKAVQSKAAEYYGTKATFFLTNGSTSGIIAAMYATLKRGEKVVIARNCHKSIYNGLVLSGAVPIWLIPDYNEEWGIYESINLDYLEEVFSRNNDVKAFIMTNPTYEGAMSDIYRISAICRKYNILLIVDEAHGALWSFNRAIGTPSIVQGADIVVQSLHKTTGALNPSALLHISKECSVNPQTIQESLNLITTTSPSYPLLLNIESTIEFLSSQKGQLCSQELIKNVNRLIRNIKLLPNIQVYSYNNDVTKLLIKVTNMSGFELSNMLFEKYRIEDELANEKSVLLLTGIGTTKSKLKKLEKALTDLCLNNIKIAQDINNNEIPFMPIEPRVRYIPAAVWGHFSRSVELRYALSRVCMEIIADYPPGAPVLLPGEVIKKEHISYLASKGRKTVKVLL